jgi:hypothetical protein
MKNKNAFLSSNTWLYKLKPRRSVLWMSGICFLTAALLAVACSDQASDDRKIGSNKDAIGNGTTVAPGQWSQLGVIQVLDTNNDRLCTGTLVRDNWVLTATSCLEGATSSSTLANVIFTYIDSSGATQIRHGAEKIVTTSHSNLVRMTSPFAVVNTINSDAPFAQNFYVGSDSSLLDKSVMCLGYGATSCTGTSGLGSLHSGTFQITTQNNQGSSYAQFAIDQNVQGQLPSSNDIGSTCFLANQGNWFLTGAMVGTDCGGPPGTSGSGYMGWSGGSGSNPSRTIYDGVEGLSDTVTDQLGALSSAKALYGLSGSALSGYWHAGQPYFSIWWRQGVVDNGWNYREVIQDGSILYGIDYSGRLFWHRHDGHYEVSPVWGPRHKTEVGQFTNWNQRHVLSGGNGIIYTIDSGGAIRWYRHKARNVGKFSIIRSNESEWHGNSGNVLGYGMNIYTHVTTPGNGIFYLRTPNGNVYWSKNYNHETGAAGNFAPLVFLRNLPDVVDIVAKDGGYLYYTTSTGALIESRHLGYQTGATTWSNGFGQSVSTPYDSTVGSQWATQKLIGSSRAY